MSAPAKEMRASLKRYLDSVNATLTDLGELEALGETFHTILASNDRINSEVADANRRISYLAGRRTDLQQEYHVALFNSDQSKITDIENQRDRIDREVSALQATVEDLPSGLQELDGSAVSELLARLHTATVPAFGARVEGTKVRLVNGSYQHTPPSGLLAQLQEGNDELIGEINAVKSRITDKANWTQYANEDVLRDIAPKVADQLFGTLASKASNQRLIEALARR